MLEAPANAWHLYDQLVPLVASANPVLVKAISTAKVKTDARDTLAPLPAPGRGPDSRDLDPSQRGAGTPRAPGSSSALGGVAHPRTQSTA